MTTKIAATRPEISFAVPDSALFEWQAVLAFYRRRAVPGVELVDEVGYTRSIEIDGRPDIVTIRHDPRARALITTLMSGEAARLAKLGEPVRRCFDLGADIAAINLHLARDPLMARLIAPRPSARVFAYWSPFETALRAVLGQQITLAGAARLNERLVRRAGKPMQGIEGCIDRLYPDPADVLQADLSNMGAPGARLNTLVAVAEAFIEAPDLFARSVSVEETVRRLMMIKGVGPWTAHYIAMRACREPDAFPAGDAGLQRAATRADGIRPNAATLERQAEAWRPWRAYAAHHLWANDPKI